MHLVSSVCSRTTLIQFTSVSPVPTFTSVFLVEAVRMNPKAMGLALNHLCWQRGEADSYEVIELLADVAVECLFASPEVYGLRTAGATSATLGPGLGVETETETGNALDKQRSELTFQPFLETFSILIVAKAKLTPGSMTFDAALLKLLQVYDTFVHSLIWPH